MPYTKNPTLSTYTTERFNLTGPPYQRLGSVSAKDQRYVNFFPELIKSNEDNSKRYFMRERPGTVYGQSGGSAGTGRGIYYWNGIIYTAIDSNLYANGIFLTTLGTSTGPVGFTEFDGTYKSLIVLDGVKGWEIKLDTSCTQITDPDFPTPHVPIPQSLDGYLFVIKAGTGDIYNSDLEDALTWTAGSFITAELFPDDLVGLVKNNNYLCAVGTQAVEFFYDAGIATGSPLQRNDSSIQQMGCAGAGTLVGTDKEIVFVGDTQNGGRTVWVLEGFKSQEIGIEAVRSSLDAEGTAITTAKAFVCRTMGHKFYVLNLTSRTWVYDFDEKMWHEWSYGNDTTPFNCDYAAGFIDGTSILLHRTNGAVLKLSPTVATDSISAISAAPIYGVITTHKIDLETNNRKTCFRLSLITDAPAVGYTPCTVQWSDNDYQTWSTARTLNISSDLSCITQLGSFRRRAFKITYTGTVPLRLEGIEMDINKGQQ